MEQCPKVCAESSLTPCTIYVTVIYGYDAEGRGCDNWRQGQYLTNLWPARPETLHQLINCWGPKVNKPKPQRQRASRNNNRSDQPC